MLKWDGGLMQKFDGVIEAVRYKNGKIDVVRAYERRGATFSDHVVLDRKTVIERLKNGKRFVTGQRKGLLASTFEIGKPIQATGKDDKLILSTRANVDHDELEGVPAF
jgi:hypothetical protein